MGKKVKRTAKWDSVVAVLLIAFAIGGFYAASLQAEGKLQFAITGAFTESSGLPAPEQPVESMPSFFSAASQKTFKVAATNINSCTNLSTPGVYLLTAGISNTDASVCMNINTSNVTLDCQGNTIDGADTDGTYGINASSVPTSFAVNVTINNCTLTDWNFALVFSDVNYSTISNNTLTSNTATPIQFTRSAHNLIVYNNASFNTLNGIQMSINSSNNTISYNFVANNTYHGILIDTSAYNNIIFNNTVTKNVLDGIRIDQAAGLVNITNNQVTKNARDGIAGLVNSTLIYNNVLFSNTRRGIDLSSDANNNTMINNNITSNTDGIWLITRNNIINNNTIQLQSASGIRISSGDGANNISNNTITSNWRGIWISANPIPNNIILKNTINSNTQDGLLFGGSELNLVQDNIINYNANGTFLSTSRNNTFINNTISHNAVYGVIINANSNNSFFINNTITNNTYFDIAIISGSTNNTFKNTDVGLNSTIGLQTGQIYLRNATQASRPGDPVGLANIGKYQNITNGSNTVAAFVYINISYTNSDVSANPLAESSLVLARYNGTWETNTTTFTSSFGNDTTNNVYFANITTFSAVFGSDIFALLFDAQPPSVANISLNTTLVASAMFFTLNVSVTDLSRDNGNVKAFNASTSALEIIANTNIFQNTTLTANALGCRGDGNCTIFVNATDLFGNSNSTEKTVLLVVDNTTPSVINIVVDPTIVKPLAQFTLNATVTDTHRDNSAVVAWNVTRSALERVGSTDVFTNTTQTASSLGCLADGNCTIIVNATDQVGNVNSSEKTTVLRVDNTTPAVTNIVLSTTLVKPITVFTLNATATDTNLNNSRVRAFNESNASLEKVGSTDVFTNTTLTANILGCPADGNCTLRINATDLAGNANDTEKIVLLEVDNTPPAATEFSIDAGNSVRFSQIINVTVNVTDTHRNAANITFGNSTQLYMSQVGSTNIFYNTTNASSLGCIVGTCIIKVIATDLIGNVNSTTTLNLSVGNDLRQAAAQALGGSGGGGGTGMIGAQGNTIIIGELNAGDKRIVSGFDGITGIDSVTIISLSEVTGVSVTISSIMFVPKEIPLPAGTVYKYIDIGLQASDKNLIKGGEIVFKVSEAWLRDNKFDANEISLMHYDALAGSWQALPTQYIYESNGDRYFSSEVSGFSLFAIVGIAPRAALAEQVAEAAKGLAKKMQIAVSPAESTVKNIIPKISAFTLKINPVVLAATLAAVLGALFIYAGAGRINSGIKNVFERAAEARQTKLRKKKRLLSEWQSKQFLADIGRVEAELVKTEGLFGRKLQAALLLLVIIGIGALMAFGRAGFEMTEVTGAVASVSQIANSTSFSLVINVAILLLTITAIAGAAYYFNSSGRQAAPKALPAASKGQSLPKFTPTIVPSKKPAMQLQARRPLMQQATPRYVAWMQKDVKEAAKERKPTRPEKAEVMIPRPAPIRVPARPAFEFREEESLLQGTTPAHTEAKKEREEPKKRMPAEISKVAKSPRKHDFSKDVKLIKKMKIDIKEIENRLKNT